MRSREVRLVREVLEVEHVCGVIHRVGEVLADAGAAIGAVGVGEVRVGGGVDRALVLDRSGLHREVLVVVARRLSVVRRDSSRGGVRICWTWMHPAVVEDRIGLRLDAEGVRQVLGEICGVLREAFLGAALPELGCDATVVWAHEG